MQMTVNVAGQVGQIKLSQAKALWPLFETVINSIQSLEDSHIDKKEITIEALRNPNIQMRTNADGSQSEEPSHFEEFIVIDNGTGFNKDNFDSFNEAYSQYKVKKGCKGIGRFLWLKAFEKVSISSTYHENGKWYHREFEFTMKGVSDGAEAKELEEGDYTNQTCVKLTGFLPRYRDSVVYGLESLAKKIIEHCLPYFILGICPPIILKDNRGEVISLTDFFEKTYKDSINQDEISLKGRQYQLYHMLLEQGADGHELHLCANNREVKSFELSKKISNLEKGKKLHAKEGDIYYVGYLTGDYLDENINIERSEFEFEDLPIMGENKPAGEEEIVDAAVDMIKQFLHDDLCKVGEQKRQQIDRIVQSEHPQYRLLLNRKPGIYDEIPSGLTDDKVDLELYKQQQKWEFETAQQKHEIEERVKQSATDDLSFQQLFDDYCRSITDLNRAGLAEYVIRRKAIIDLLEKALESDEEGRYSKEARIHTIICPMQVSSNDIKCDDMNLWLIDDRLAYHHYLASDKKMNTLPVLESDIDKRMDLAIFDAALSYTADPENINSITIVELKRPMRNDVDNDPVRQVLNYVRDIKAGKLKKANGRNFGDMDRVSFYCYVIGDMTPTMHDSAKGAGLTVSQDKQGYFGYNSAYGAYVEVISYDKLLKDAKQRNKVLFDKLFESKGELVHPELIGN